MNSADMASLVPNPDELLALPVKEQGRLILKLLSSNGEAKNELTGPTGGGRVNRHNFFNRAGDFASRPKYGSRQKEVDESLMGAWAWLAGQGFLAEDPTPGHDWFFVSKAGKGFLKGVAHPPASATPVPTRLPLPAPAPSPAAERISGTGKLALVADSRLAELRKLVSSNFDFTKLIRLCEELNITSREECHFATAMLTRGLLDHVPPLFGNTSFTEVANNYGGRSFKEMMQPLDGVARKGADWHLHGQIRKSEVLPTAQQVSFASSLDMLLSEIARITR